MAGEESTNRGRERNAWIGLVLLLGACVFLFHQEQSANEAWREQMPVIDASAVQSDQELADWQPVGETSSVPVSVRQK